MEPCLGHTSPTLTGSVHQFPMSHAKQWAIVVYTGSWRKQVSAWRRKELPAVP